MAIQYIAVRLAPRVAAYVTRWLRTASPTSRMPLGIFRSNSLDSRAYQTSVGLGRGYARHNWNRTRVPLYGSPTVNIPAVTVLVPARRMFEWLNEEYINVDLPNITFRPARNRALYNQHGIPLPDVEMQIRRPPLRGAGSRLPPEYNRRRKDQKIPYGIRRIYTFMHKALDEPSEYLEFLTAYQQNANDPAAFATALAFNQAVDYSVGTRARLLKKHVYQSKHWNLPVGYDTLSRIWR